MINETYYINELKKHEYNFKKFMGIETFPQYTICSKEASVLSADSQGYESIARSHFDVKTIPIHLQLARTVNCVNT